MEFSVSKQALNTGNLPTKGKVKSSTMPCMQHIVQNFSLPPSFTAFSYNIMQHWIVFLMKFDMKLTKLADIWNLVVERLTFALELGWLCHINFMKII